MKDIKWAKHSICKIYEECEGYEENPLKPWEGCFSLFTDRLYPLASSQIIFTPTTELRPHYPGNLSISSLKICIYFECDLTRISKSESGTLFITFVCIFTIGTMWVFTNS